MAAFSGLLAQTFKYWPLLLPLILLLPSLNAFPYPSPSAVYSDLTVTHLPNALFLRQAIFEGHTLPLWSPLILSGYPFAANPLSGLWYPPGWLALLLPLPLGFNLLVAAHLLWGGIGMYRLLRAEGLAPPAALFGGLAFELLPKFYAHYGAGHLTLLFAVSWTPWLIYSVAGCRLESLRVRSRRTLRPMGQPSPSNAQSSKFPFRPAIILSLIFLADPRWAAFAGLLFCFYTFFRTRPQQILSEVQTGECNIQSTNLPIYQSTITLISNLQSLLSTLYFLIPQIFLTFLLAAPLALPLLQYSQLSTRSQMDTTDLLAFSLPPARLLGLVFPNFQGFHEWVLYPGALVFMLAVLAIGLFKGNKGESFHSARFWTWTAIASLLYALGSNLPLLAWVGNLPGLDLLRVPSRALFVAGFALAALAASSIERVWRGLMENERRRAGLLLTGLAGFSIVFSGGVLVMAGRLPLSFGWGTGILLAGVVLTGLVLRKRLPVRIWFAGLLLLTCLDLGLVDLSSFAPRSAEQVWAEQGALRAFLSAQPGMFRVYSPSYSLPQHAAVLSGQELADGVDPLQLKAYTAFMASASGVPQDGYSVTLPPMKNSDPSTANRSYSPDPALLGLLNVRFVAAEYDLRVQGLTLLARYGNTRLYENNLTLPRAWIQPPTAALGEKAQAVEIRLYSPNRIELSTPAGGSSLQLLVLSELAYPGWRAWVDGAEAAVQVQAGLLRSLLLPPGPHQVTFAFRPTSVYWGLALWAVGVLSILFFYRAGVKFSANAAKRRIARIFGIEGMKIIRDIRTFAIFVLKKTQKPISNPQSPYSERRWVITFAALILLITSIPYLIGYAGQGKDWVFTGFVFGVEDGNSYLAKMLGGSAGAWTFLTPFTAYPQKGVAAFLPYLLIGKLAAPPGLHIQLTALFHIFRIASGFLAILATYDFLSYILRKESLRRFALVLAVCGGGLGWLLVLLGKSGWLGSLPLEFYSPETFGFLGLYGIPHLSLARAALLWGLLGYLKSAQAIRRSPNSWRRRTLSRNGLKIGLFWLLAAVAQPLTALVFGGLIALHLAAMAFWVGWRQSSFSYQVGFLWPQRAPQIGGGLKSLRASKYWTSWKNTVLLASFSAVLPAPFLLYNTLAFSLDPFLKAWTAQNRILSPHPLHYLLAYGLLAPFAVFGARRLAKRRPWEGTFFITWICALPFLAYTPVNLQRRLPEGVWVSVVVLALAAFDGRRSGNLEAGDTGNARVPRAVYLLLLAFPSTLLLLSGGILAALKPSEPVFRPAQEVNAFQFLQENARRGEVVLSSYEAGNALPAWTPLRTVIGHGPESVNLAGLLPRVARFYNGGTSDQERIDFLREFNVSYVFLGPHERSLGAWNPDGAPFLEPIYASSGYQIFKVKQNSLNL